MNCRTQCLSFLKLMQAISGADGSPTSLPIAFWLMLEDRLLNPVYDYRGFLQLKLPRFGFNLNGKATALDSLLRLLREVTAKDVHILTRQSFREGEVLAAYMLNSAAVETVACGLDASSLEAAVRFIGDRKLPQLRSLTIRMDPLLKGSQGGSPSTGFDSFIHLVLSRAPYLEMLELSDCFVMNYREEASFALSAISDALRKRNEMGHLPIHRLRIQGIDCLLDDSGRSVVELFTQSLPQECRPNLELQGQLLLKFCGAV